MDGYISINCKGLELNSSNPQIIPGIYARVAEAYKTNKPCYVYNATWDLELMTPISVMITYRSSGNYIATASTLQVEVDNEDVCTIINMLAPTQSKKSNKGE